MSTEIIRRQAVEPDDSRSSWTLFLCEKVNSHTEVKPARIDVNSDDEVSRFIVDTIEKFDLRIRDLRLPVGKYLGRGHRRPSSQIRRINEDRERMINELTEHREILRGRRNQSISLIRDRETKEIIGFKILGPQGCAPTKP